MELIDLLRRVHPFRFLRGTARERVAAALRPFSFGAGETVFRRNDVDQSVYLLEEGEVEIFDTHRRDDEVIMVIPPFRFFGEWEAIFEEPRMFGARARTACRGYVLDGDTFRETLNAAPGFAQGFSTILRHNQGIFAAFDRFKTSLLQSADQGHISVEALVPLYRSLQPALHPGVDEPYRIDVGALQYAVRRLPENVTGTFAFLLADEIPEALAGSARSFPPIRTTARRRDIREVLPGKDLVLLRTGNSDLIDLVTSLCLYAVEARKIRERVIRDNSLPAIEAYLGGGTSGGPQDARSFLNTLSFSSREVDGLVRIWPEETVRRVSEITRHREMFSIDVRRHQRNSQARRDELWTAEVARVTADLLGTDPADLSPDRGVHIISSNTHSVSNCLNPWFREHGDRVLAWARDNGHPAAEDSWREEQDLVYALARDYVTAHPEEGAAAAETAREAGHLSLGETVGTGIQVQLIDLTRIVNVPIDPAVAPVAADSPAADDLIVNIDYAFGEQAEYVIRNLLTLYGESIRSVSFLGKAGALVGRRGDILAPTAFIEQHSDLFQPVPPQTEPTGFPVHTGPMLTVDGTLLQNRQMLNFYRHIWNVVGIEMEGTHYYREILESRQLGVIRPDVAFRFLYYVSDLPLDTGSSLAAPLRAAEGVPPLYAITRSILNQIIRGVAR